MKYVGKLLISGATILTLAMGGLACSQAPKQQESSLETVAVEVPKPERVLEDVVVKEFDGKMYEISGMNFVDKKSADSKVQMMYAVVGDETRIMNAVIKDMENGSSIDTYFADNNELTLIGTYDGSSFSMFGDAEGDQKLDLFFAEEEESGAWFMVWKETSPDLCEWSSTPINFDCNYKRNLMEAVQPVHYMLDSFLRDPYNERKDLP